MELRINHVRINRARPVHVKFLFEFHVNCLCLYKVGNSGAISYLNSLGFFVWKYFCNTFYINNDGLVLLDARDFYFYFCVGAKRSSALLKVLLRL